jgi:hypothetical protein
LNDPNTTLDTPRSRSLPLVGGLAIGGGLALMAFAGGWLLHRPDAVTVEVPRAPTEAELAVACAPEVQEVRDELTTAQARVAELEREQATKTAELNDLQARVAKGGSGGGELARVKAELAEVKEQLRIAVAEKERLLVELQDTQQELQATKEELVVTKTQRDEAKEDALANRWTAFLADAQLEICEKGNRKKLGNCREVVEATLAADARRDRFAHCIRSGQAQPIVRELEKDGELPQFAAMIDEEQKQVRGWYVNFCDPTLPERPDAPLAESHLPASPSAASNATPGAPAAPATAAQAG